MPQIFTTSFSFPYSFPTLVYAVINKYPATLAPHVISIDVLERTMMEDGTIRSERVLGVQQESPKWVNRVSPACFYRAHFDSRPVFGLTLSLLHQALRVGSKY